LILRIAEEDRLVFLRGIMAHSSGCWDVGSSLIEFSFHSYNNKDQ